MRQLRVGVVGAGGVVGQEILRILAERAIPVEELRLGATARSAGSTIRFRGEDVTVTELTPAFFQGLDMAFFAASTDASREWGPVASRSCLVIDKSNAFRLDPNVPLVVPEVNPDAARLHQGIIASPNCSTIQLVVALAPIKRRFGLRRVVVSTYQSVSGTGRDAIDELYATTRAVLNGDIPQPRVYPVPIAFNLIPAIESFDDDGYCLEELKLRRESERIFGHPVNLSATAVRVPVVVGHAESVNFELEHDASLEQLREALRTAPGVKLVDDPKNGIWPTPQAAEGKDDVFVGRLRRDPTAERAFHMLVVADNLRKGAALNAVQIAELILN